MTTTRKHPSRGLDLADFNRESVIRRFWPKVAVGDPDECWEWQAARRKEREYGLFQVGASTGYGAHIVSAAISHGPVPAGAVVCHTCDNPPCVNPGHLFIADHRANALDMFAKGRGNSPIGRRNYHAKLTPDQVREIRATSTPLPRGELKRIADHYGVSGMVIRGILDGTGWRWVA